VDVIRRNNWTPSTGIGGRLRAGTTARNHRNTQLYELIASDMTAGTLQSPTFGDAVKLHRLINAIEQSGGVACDV